MLGFVFVMLLLGFVKLLNLGMIYTEVNGHKFKLRSLAYTIKEFRSVNSR